MNLNFKSIKLESALGVITMKPDLRHFYEVTDHSVKYVILYELESVSRDGRGPTVKTTIPYYVSSGVTNKLRANMLYPFMCYSNMSDADTCPFNVNVKGNPFSPVLIKYNVVESIDIRALEHTLIEHFAKIFPNPKSDVERLQRVLLQESRNDLVSVLKRLTNLVDFVICISCDSVQNFEPTPNEVAAVKSGKYCSLSQAQIDAGVDYTDLSIPGQEGEYEYVSHMSQQRERENARSDFNTNFRVAILATLKAYYDLFSLKGLVVSSVAATPPVRITVSELNRFLNACNKEATQRNIESYKHVSMHMMDIVRVFAPEGLLRSRVHMHENTYDTLLQMGYTCKRRDSQIGTSNVFQLSEQDEPVILGELQSYSDFIKSQTVTRKKKDGTTVIESLKPGFDKFITETVQIKDVNEKMKRLRDSLIDIRIRKMKSEIKGRGGGGGRSRSQKHIKSKNKNFRNKSKKSKPKNKKSKSKNKIKNKK